jgi:hypothetical protein
LTFSHVYVIVMENKGYDNIVGNANAPYINSLIADYGLATNYDGVAHPSEPNYLALSAARRKALPTTPSMISPGTTWPIN